MSAQRKAEMLLASLRRSNVQLLLRLRPPLHTVISTRAPGYGPLQWADCQLPWIKISQRVLRAIRRRRALHIEYSCCFTGYNRLEDPASAQPERSAVFLSSYLCERFASVHFCIRLFWVYSKNNRWQCEDAVSSPLALTSRWYQILNFLFFVFFMAPHSHTLKEVQLKHVRAVHPCYLL